VSRLWRDRLAVALAPDRVALVRTGGIFASRVMAKAILPVALEPDGGWRPALTVLSQALRTRREFQEARLAVVLSNAFVRYQLVPWSDAVENDAECGLYVRESFADVHGEPALGWTYRIASTGPEAPWLAAAVDSPLAQQLEEVADATGSTLVSLQPQLMPAFNAARKTLGPGDAWFAQVDGDRLLLALVHKGQWAAIGNHRLGTASWQDALPPLAEREWQLYGSGAAPRTVFVAERDAAVRTVALGE